MDDWIEESEIVVNIRTGEYHHVDPYQVYGIGLNPDEKWLKDLSKTDILQLWKRDRQENRIVY